MALLAGAGSDDFVGWSPALSAPIVPDGTVAIQQLAGNRRPGPFSWPRAWLMVFCASARFSCTPSRPGHQPAHQLVVLRWGNGGFCQDSCCTVSTTSIDPCLRLGYGNGVIGSSPAGRRSRKYQRGAFVDCWHW